MSVTDKTIQLIISAKDRTSAVLGKMRAGLQQFGKVAKVAVMASAAAISASAVAIGAVVNKTLAYGDSLAKTADKLGLTTGALAGMRHAGDLAGVAMAALDNSVKFMNKNLSDAAAGTGEAKVAFDALGLSAKELQDNGPEKAFSQIIEKLDGVGNASDRVNYAMKIFGKSGADVLNMTADGLREAKVEAEAFGLAMSRSDAKQMEDVNDAMTRIKAAFTGAGVALTISLVEPLKGFALKLVDLAKSGTLAAWGRQIGEVAGRAIDWISDMVIGVGKFDAVLDIAAGSFGGFRDMVATIINQVSAFVLEGFGQIAGAIDTMTFGAIPGLDDIENEFKTLALGAREAAGETSASWQQNSDKVAKAWETLSSKGKATKFDQVADGLKATADEAKNVPAAVGAAGSSLEAAGEKAEKAKEKTQDYQLELLKLATDSRLKVIEMGFDLQTEQLKSQTEKAKAIIASIDTSITSTGDLLGSLFGNLAEAGSFQEKWQIEDQIKDENRRREETFKLQQKLTEQELKLNELRISRMKSGDALIKLDPGTLEPALEMIYWHVFEKVQVRVNEEAAEMLLGV